MDHLNNYWNNDNLNQSPFMSSSSSGTFDCTTDRFSPNHPQNEHKKDYQFDEDNDENRRSFRHSDGACNKRIPDSQPSSSNDSQRRPSSCNSRPTSLNCKNSTNSDSYSKYYNKAQHWKSRNQTSSFNHFEHRQNNYQHQIRDRSFSPKRRSRPKTQKEEDYPQKFHQSFYQEKFTKPRSNNQHFNQKHQNSNKKQDEFYLKNNNFDCRGNRSDSDIRRTVSRSKREEFVTRQPDPNHSKSFSIKIQEKKRYLPNFEDEEWCGNKKKVKTCGEKIESNFPKKSSEAEKKLNDSLKDGGQNEPHKNKLQTKNESIISQRSTNPKKIDNSFDEQEIQKNMLPIIVINNNPFVFKKILNNKLDEKNYNKLKSEFNDHVYVNEKNHSISGNDIYKQTTKIEKTIEYQKNASNNQVAFGKKECKKLLSEEKFSVAKDPKVNYDIIVPKLMGSIKSSLQNPYEKIIIRRNKNSINDLHKLAHHVLIQEKNNTLVFAENFLNKNKKLPGNLDTLREIMVQKLENDSIAWSDIKKCKFSIKNFFYNDLNSILAKLSRTENKKNMEDLLGQSKTAEVTDEFKNGTDDLKRQGYPKQEEIENRSSIINNRELLNLENSENKKKEISQLDEYQEPKTKFIEKFKLPQLSFNFKIKALDKFEARLSLDRGGRIVLLETDSLKLTKIKLFQCLQNISKLKNSSFYVKLEELSGENNDFENLYDLIESPAINVLIIECDNLKVNIQSIEICNYLTKIFKSSVDKILIVIGNSERFFERFKKNCEQIKDTFDGLSELTENTILKLYQEISISLHDHPLKLAQLLNLSTIREMKISPISFPQLVEGKYSLDIRCNSPINFSENYYIEKKLLRNIIISDDIFRENKTDDIFIIKNISAERLQYFIPENEKIFDMDDLNKNIEITAKFFLMDCKIKDLYCSKFLKICKKNVHVLEYDYNSMKFIWLRTIGSIHLPLKFKINEMNSCFRKKKIENNTLLNENSHERIIIITGDLGAGKSTFMDNFEKKFHNNSITSFNEPRWLIRINLNNITFLGKDKVALNNIRAAAYFITNSLRYDELRKSLFFKTVMGEIKIKLVLLLDGLEELDYACTSFIIKLLKTLVKSKIEKIFITTTPKKKEIFELEFNTFSYSLDSFSKEDKTSFLLNYWAQFQKTNKIKICLSRHIEDFLEFYDLSLTANPLFLKMLARINEEYVIHLSNHTKFIGISNLCDIFKKFYDLIEKSILNGDKLLEIQNLSLKCLLNKSDFSGLIIKNYMQEISANKIQYISHTMFAEFFAAKNLAQKSFSTEETCNYIDTIIVSASPTFFHCIVNLFQLDERENFRAFTNILTKKGYINFLDSLLKYKEINYFIQRELLDLAIENNNLVSVKFFLDRINFSEGAGKYSETFYSEPTYKLLQAAIKCKHLKTIQFLEKKSPDDFLELLTDCLQTEKINLSFSYDKKTDNQTNISDQILENDEHFDTNFQILEFIIDHYEINKKNDYGENLICIAIKKSLNLNTIKYLVKKGADLNAQDESGLYAWCYAILENMNNYNKKDQVKIMEYFLEKPLKIKLLENEEVNPQIESLWLEVLQKLEYFQRMESFDLNIDEDTGNLRLESLVTSTENIDRIWSRFLISFGADVNLKVSDGRSLMHLAIEAQNYEIAKTLFQYGAVFNTKDRWGRTPLKLLENYPNYGNETYNQLLNLLKKAHKVWDESFKTLLKINFSTFENHARAPTILNTLLQNELGYSMVHIAALKNEITLIKNILSFSSVCFRNFPDFPLTLSVDAHGHLGNTPLHLTALMGSKDIIELLMTRNSCYDSKNFKGKTPIEYAKQYNHDWAIDLLNSADELFQKLTSEIEISSRIEDIKDLVSKYPCLVNTRSNFTRRTPVHCAAMLKNSQIMEFFVSIDRVRINVTDSCSKTPLHYAAEKDNIETVKLLLKHNVIIDLKDINNKRPFDFGGKKNKSTEMLLLIYELFEDMKSERPRIFADNCSQKLSEYLRKLKLSYGIEESTVLNVRDSKRNYLLYYAVKYDYHHAVVNLLKHGAGYNPENADGIKIIDIAKSSKILLQRIDNIVNIDIDFNYLSRINIEKDIFNCRVLKDNKSFALMEYLSDKKKTLLENWLKSICTIK